jgi:DNA invertase Pin-like site-specific DNA recombinase
MADGGTALIPASGEHPRLGMAAIGRASAHGAAAQGPVRVAFAGRTSTEDQQDPTISIPRQLRSCRSALPEQAVMVAHFYDVESGRAALAQRGRGRAHERFSIPVPRDGGIADLLAEAERSDRRFDVVICESIDRISRRTYEGTLIEHTLEKAGVLLLASDEPITLTGKRATQVLTRRVKQGIAEWYVLEMLEKAWGGFCEHTDQGFNIGKPPYGYAAEKVPHPVPARRAQGKSKTRLIPDPDRAAAVQAMFAWRVVERLGYAAIADRLNTDLVSYPPPQPTRLEMAVGRWTESAVHGVLHNPKYTGYMVWNRRATKRLRGRVNPVSDWVWSSRPTHDALTSRDLFLAAWGVAEQRERSRSVGANDAHPQTKREYRLRTYLFCAECDRRMFGKARRETLYYACETDGKVPEGHPRSLWVREDQLLNGLNWFFNSRILGEDRRELLSAELAELDTSAAVAQQDRTAAIRHSLATNQTSRSRLIRSLETTDDPYGDLANEVNRRLAELRAEHVAVTEELERIEASPVPVPAPELLDGLPLLSLDLSRLPEARVRAIFEAFRLQMYYDRRNRTVRCRVTLTGDTVAAAADSVAKGEQTAALTCGVPICFVPPAGFEPAHLPPEGSALSPELRGLSDRVRLAALSGATFGDPIRFGHAQPAPGPRRRRRSDHPAAHRDQP